MKLLIVDLLLVCCGSHLIMFLSTFKTVKEKAAPYSMKGKKTCKSKG
jgi:hypothetical protein